MTIEERRQIVRYLGSLGFAVVSASGDGGPGSPFRLVVEVNDDPGASEVGRGQED